MDANAEPSRTFLRPAPSTPEAQALLDGDLEDPGFVMNVSRLWAHRPDLQDGIARLIGQSAEAASLSYRQKGILVACTASAMEDSYCSLAWGRRLAGAAGDDVAAGVLRGDDGALDPAEQTLARWARRVARDPNATTPEDVEALREAGYSDADVLALTCFIALRMAFSTVNDALGAVPDHELHDAVPAPVRDAVTWGRPMASPPGD